jgi:hypothetical protein
VQKQEVLSSPTETANTNQTDDSSFASLPSISQFLAFTSYIHRSLFKKGLRECTVCDVWLVQVQLVFFYKRKSSSIFSFFKLPQQQK